MAAGDLSRPVSVYRRHATNTFRPGCENHVHMVRAVADAYRWARAYGAPRDRLDAFEAAAGRYVRRALLAGLDAGRPGVTWRVLGGAVQGGLLSPTADPQGLARALWTAVRGSFAPPMARRDLDGS